MAILNDVKPGKNSFGIEFYCGGMPLGGVASLMLCSEKIMRSIAIKIDPDILGGAPCFAGTRVPVKTLFDFLENGDSLDVFLDEFPSVRHDQAVALLEESRQALLAA
ncbi:MAG: DUF433 domain-containing protein [Sulfuricellaceae bacterium]